MRRHDSRGFSLIELLLGLTIFTTAFLMILGIFPSSMKALHQGRQILLATHVAQSQLETYMAGKGFGDLAVGTYTPSSPTILSTVNGSPEVMSYSTQIVVSVVSSDLKDVRCLVTWQESIPGQTTSLVRYVSLETMVANL
jgi:prepilin-type N-terminal cleavage/methylation domain-containing protein